MRSQRHCKGGENIKKINFGKYFQKSRQTGHDTRDPRVRSFLLKRDRSTCFYCGRVYNKKKAKIYPWLYFDKVHIDHVIPFSRGGRNHVSNYVISCSTCNLRKGDEILFSL